MAAAVTAVFAPKPEDGSTNLLLAEAGTGIGKTLAYLAPASLWAEASGGTVWVSTFTKALQRQLDAEGSRLFADPVERAKKIVIRKGRENYLCLLNLEDAMQGAFAGRAAILAHLVGRWAAYTRDGDMVGGDLPGWLPSLFRRAGATALTDRRGECVYAGCPHFRRCFIERAERAGREADIVIANHALVMINAARARESAPTRILFDEGHHLFEAADSTFAVSFSGQEAIEFRRWIVGPEGRSRGRRRGRAARLMDVASYDDEGGLALEAAIEAARALPSDGWLARVAESDPFGPVEALLNEVRGMVYARAKAQEAGYGLETELAEPDGALVAASAAALETLEALQKPLAALARRLEAVLDDAPDWLDSQARARVDGAIRGLAWRRETLAAWIALLGRVGGSADPNFVDWLAIERSEGREYDVAIHRRWLDPTKPLATRTLIHSVKAGNPLIIFPEGRITVTGSLMKVYDGAAMIADKSEAMLVPVRIKGLEKTHFSRLGRSQVRRSLFPKVTVTILEPLRLSVDPALKGKRRRMAAGALLYTVMSDLIFRTTSTDRTIIEAVIAAATIHGNKKVAVEDPIGGSLTYKRLLLGAAILGRKLMPLAAAGEAVGVMMPNANGAVVAILALMSAGRVPAMMNFTSGLMNLRAACKAANIQSIVTSRTFVEKAHLEKLIEGLTPEVAFTYLEDVRSQVGFVDKLRGLREAKRPLLRRAPDDAVAILFTSGSEGTPKGVVLSNRNMLANAAQAEARIDFGRTDKVFNVLPLFHSFGLTVGLVLPLVSGVGVYLYPTPLHYRIIPEMIYGTDSTILFGTDTFLAGYARTAHSYDFRSLRYILAGAEPVKETTRRAYMEKFGLRILEGYGVTETAPALALNTPMFNRFGSVGRLLPGMEARLDPVPGVEVGGRLFVRGPNVMLGYLRVENPGVLERPEGGWHDTGDIVAIDADGYITIKGRAKRFAKIGGEMISLSAVELLAAELWPDAMSGAATVPDARKGERLILVTTMSDPKRSDFLAFARARGASEMMVPTEVLILEKLPLLGSGKIDNVALTNFVRERANVESPALSAVVSG
jgi:acyl-CoA synthetase (AMP-forming)/AMP-acid ligase II